MKNQRERKLEINLKRYSQQMKDVCNDKILNEEIYEGYYDTKVKKLYTKYILNLHETMYKDHDLATFLAKIKEKGKTLWGDNIMEIFDELVEKGVTECKILKL